MTLDEVVVVVEAVCLALPSPGRPACTISPLFMFQVRHRCPRQGRCWGEGTPITNYQYTHTTRSKT